MSMNGNEDYTPTERELVEIYVKEASGFTPEGDPEAANEARRAIARIKAEALREAAREHMVESARQGVGDPTAASQWLRARADRIEEGS